MSVVQKRQYDISTVVCVNLGLIAFSVRIPTDGVMFTVDINGALTVTSVKDTDTGEYTCTADNGIGFPASQRVNMVVQGM